MHLLDQGIYLGFYCHDIIIEIIEEMKRGTMVLRPLQYKLKLDRPNNHIHQKAKGIHLSNKDPDKQNQKTYFFEAIQARRIQNPSARNQQYLRSEAASQQRSFKSPDKTQSLQQNAGSTITAQNSLRVSIKRSKSSFWATLNEPSTSNKKSRTTYMNFSGQASPSSFADQLFNSLAKCSAISMKKESAIIKKQILLALLSRVIQAASGLQNRQVQETTSNSELKPILNTIGCKLKLNRARQRARKLDLISQVQSHKFQQEDYRAEFQKCRLRIDTLIAQESNLLAQIGRLEHKRSHLQIQIDKFHNICQKYKAETILWQSKVQQQQQMYQSYQQESQRLKQAVQETNNQLKQVEEQAKRVATFVQTQNDWPLIKYVGEQFKKLEGEIFDYAFYLQHDGVFCSLDWEPKPYSVIENFMQQDMKRMNDYIMREGPSLQEKKKKMVEFVLSCMGKYQRKDEEMRKINRLKTEAIIKFIEMMQKWVQNFEIKEDHFGSLRKDYVISAGKINKRLDLLLSSGLSAEHLEILQVIKVQWKKIEDNYKYCTYFY